jgi:hypothetical protein
MDKKLFGEACERTITNKAACLSKGIGTLGEKTLHSVLKNYFGPDTACQERPLAGFVADILTDNGVVEIQTQNFDQLRKKLERFLELTDVTVVYPVARTKWLVWIDESTGETTKKRRSPKTGRPCEALYELYKIRSLLSSPRLRFCIVLLDLEEYRLLNGWSRDRKKGSERYDRIPVDIAGEVWIGGPRDYDKLIPEELKGDFTVKDFKKASGLSPYASGLALSVLYTVGAVVRTGKKGNAYVYERAYI